MGEFERSTPCPVDSREFYVSTSLCMFTAQCANVKPAHLKFIGHKRFTSVCVCISCSPHIALHSPSKSPTCSACTHMKNARGEGYE